jgi:thiosulfate/3-mercaptopyruvate sulfurtransferase
MTYATLIGPAALATLIADEAVVVIDCQFDLADPAAGEARYRAGHVPGARYFHLDRDLAGPPDGSNGRHPLPDPVLLAARLRAAGLCRGEQVVAYDGSGGAFAARLWWLLRWLGHEAVAVLDGGLPAWVAAGLPVESGEAPAAASGDFDVGASHDDMIVDTAAVLANLRAPRFLVVDARTAARFRGEPNPLDPVAGHIPGASNRFYGDNLDAAGRFRPAAELKAAFANVLGGVSPDEVVLQCGSGVTACHNALAMAVAGLPGARLYSGSWSEWIADPRRPVA